MSEVHSASPKVSLIFSRGLWEEVMFITRKVAPYEVSGLCEIEVVRPGRMEVRRIHLLQQKCELGETELSSKQVAKLQSDLIREYDGEDEGSENWLLKLWFHTHGEGTTFWSSVDEATCKGLRVSGEWFVSLVVNTEGEALARIDGEGEFGPFMTVVDVRVASTLSQQQKEALEKEIKEKVTLVKRLPPHTNTHPASMKKELARLKTIIPDKTCGECGEFQPSKEDGGVSGLCKRFGEEVLASSPACGVVLEGDKSAAS